VLPAADAEDVKLFPVLEVGGRALASEADEILPARDLDDKVLAAFETDNILAVHDEVLPAGEADDKLLPALEAGGGASESEADDEVLLALDKVLLACDTDDEVLVARVADTLLPALEAYGRASESEVDGEVLLVRDEVLPAGEVANGVEVPCNDVLPMDEASEAGDNLLVAGGVFMAVPEALPGAMGRTRFHSSLSTCFRNSGYRGCSQH